MFANKSILMSKFLNVRPNSLRNKSSSSAIVFCLPPQQLRHLTNSHQSSSSSQANTNNEQVKKVIVPPIHSSSLFEKQQLSNNDLFYNYDYRSFHSFDNFREEMKKDNANADPSKPQLPLDASYTARIQYYVRKDLERVMKATSIYNVRVWLSILGGIVLCAIVFWDTIIQFWSKQGADVAKGSLSDEELLRNATDSLKKVTTQALQAPETLEKLIGLLKSLLEQPETKTILITFLLQVLKDPSTQVMAKDFFSIVLQGLLAEKGTQEYAVVFLKSLLADPSFQTSAIDLVKTIMKNESTRQSLIELLKYVLSDDVLRTQYAVPFVQTLIQHPALKDQLAQLGSNAVHDILDNKQVQEHAVVFVKHVLENQTVHKQGGDALWQILKNTFVPTWFTSGGTVPIPQAPQTPKVAQQTAEQVNAASAVEVETVAATVKKE